MNVINPAVLSCLDEMFYRLPFPNLVELERLIKADNCETAMHDFRTGLRLDLNKSRAIPDFEKGWEKYWRETGSQGASQDKQTKSFQDRTQSPSPEPRESASSATEGGGEGGSGSDQDNSQSVQ